MRQEKYMLTWPVVKSEGKVSPCNRQFSYSDSEFS